MSILFALTVAALPQEPAVQQPACEPCCTITGSVGLVSNYVFRGLTQTNQEPALQAGLLATLPSGLYAGMWGSSVSWFSDAYPTTSSSLEIDLYAGYKHSLGEGFSCDVGLLRYQYPGDYPGIGGAVVEPDTTELYAALSWKMLTLKGSYSLGDTFGVNDSSGTWYADLTGSFELPQDFLLCLHAGRQEYSGENSGVSNDSLYSYSDYSAMLCRPIGMGFTLGITYSHADTEDAGYTILGDNIGEDQWVLSLVKSF